MMKALLLVTLAIHLSITAYSMRTGGIWGAFPPFNDVWTYQIFSDLLVSIGLLWLVLYRRAKRRGRPMWKVWACGLGIVLSGSIATLLYLALGDDLLDDV